MYSNGRTSINGCIFPIRPLCATYYWQLVVCLLCSTNRRLFNNVYLTLVQWYVRLQFVPFKQIAVHYLNIDCDIIVYVLIICLCLSKWKHQSIPMLLNCYEWGSLFMISAAIQPPFILLRAESEDKSTITIV